MIRKLSLCLFSIILMFILIVNAQALNVIKGENYTFTSQGVEHTIYKKTDNETSSLLYCVSGANVAIDEGNSYVDDSSLTEEQRLTIGNIISNSSLEYVEKEQAIFTYLNETGKSTDSESIPYKAQLNANTVANNYKNATSTLNVSELKFTLDGESYRSQIITITSSSNLKNVSWNITSTNDKITPTIEEVETNKKFRVIISKNQFESANEKVTIGVSFSATFESSSIKVYKSTKTDKTYQLLAKEEPVTKTITNNISGVIGQTKLTINKYDSNSKALSGATIKVTGPNGYSKTFVTDGNSIVLIGLEFGTYKIEEISAPEGYIKTSGETIVLSSSNLTEIVDLYNDMTMISITKYDDDGKTKLQGANLKLVDEAGNIINKCPDERNKSFLCEWTTTKSPKVIEGLPAGTYYLVEESAPKGYDLINTKIKIVISQSGKVTVDGVDVENGKIEFYNSLTRTEISKVSAADGKELEGATLEILDSEEKIISCTILESSGKTKDLDKCTWTSGKEKTIIKGLPAGTYYLKETLAPEGYELNENKIKFEVKADGTVTSVKMENNLLVEVPDTLSSRSALLIAISMFDIALGIGILTYVKKSKVK